MAVEKRLLGAFILVAMSGLATAELPDEFGQPVRAADLQMAIPDSGMLRGCHDYPDRLSCWFCTSEGCSYKEKSRLGEWWLSCNLFVAPDGATRGCWISGSGLSIGISSPEDSFEISYRANRGGKVVLHAERPVYVWLDDKRFVSPESSSYSELELHTESGDPVSNPQFLRELQAAHRITTEIWGKDDQKFSASDYGEGLDDAIAKIKTFCERTE